MVRLCSGYSGTVGPLEVCAPFCLLDALGVLAGDFVRVCWVAVGVEFATGSSFAVITTMTSWRLLLAY